MFRFLVKWLYLLKAVKIVKNDNPRWTKNSVDHLRKYDKNSYGQVFTEVEFMTELRNIKNGNPSSRVNMTNIVEYFDIYVDRTLIGEFFLDLNHELTMAIYDQFSNKGFGERALKKYLKNNTHWPIFTTIQPENNLQKKILDMLKKNGFIEDGHYVLGKTPINLIRNEI